MNELKRHYGELIDRYKRKGMVLDTNLLVLLIIGSISKQEISKHKRTKEYTIRDYELLRSLIIDAKLMTTPNIMTELSNIAVQGGRHLNRNVRSRISVILEEMTEVYLKSQEISKARGFLEFGLTDAGISEVSSKGFLVMTDDSPLAAYLSREKKPVVDFSLICGMKGN